MQAQNELLDTLDLGSAVQRALGSLAGLRGAEALTLAIGLALLDVPLAALAWHYDIQPTLQASAGIAAQVMPSLPASAAPYAAIVGLLFTLAPTIAEFTLPRLASAGLRLVAIGIYALAAFDLYTDFPRVQATMEQIRPGFDGFAMLATPVWCLAFALLWIMATFGFELIAITAAISAAKLLVQSRGGSGRGGAP